MIKLLKIGLVLSLSNKRASHIFIFPLDYQVVINLFMSMHTHFNPYLI